MSPPLSKSLITSQLKPIGDISRHLTMTSTTTFKLFMISHDPSIFREQPGKAWNWNSFKLQFVQPCHHVIMSCVRVLSSLMYLAKEFQRHAILSGALTCAIENGLRLRRRVGKGDWLFEVKLLITDLTWEMMEEVGDIWSDRHTKIWKKGTPNNLSTWKQILEKHPKKKVQGLVPENPLPTTLFRFCAPVLLKHEWPWREFSCYLQAQPTESSDLAQKLLPLHASINFSSLRVIA